MAKSGTQLAAVRTTRKGVSIHKTNERPGTRAQIRFVRVSPSKAREVLNLIRGKHIQDAAEILQFTERAVSETVSKALDSAVANAVNNDEHDPETLYISACYADEGPTLKRWRPRARGRATRIRKRTSHITIIVSRLDDETLRIRNARLERVSGGGAGESRASRRARVASSRQADAARDADEDTTVDETPTDETVATDDVIVDETTEPVETDEAIEPVDAEEATGETDEAPEAEETDEKDED